MFHQGFLVYVPGELLLSWESRHRPLMILYDMQFLDIIHYSRCGVFCCLRLTHTVTRVNMHYPIVIWMGFVQSELGWCTKLTSVLPNYQWASLSTRFASWFSGYRFRILVSFTDPSVFSKVRFFNKKHLVCRENSDHGVSVVVSTDTTRPQIEWYPCA